jgi:hypothetical protein
VEIPKNDYIRNVLDAYRRTPTTSGVVHRNDRLLAAKLYDGGIPLSAIQNALILASARRIARLPDAPPLQPIRSLYYMLPVIEEVLGAQVPPDYYSTLQLKVDYFVRLKQWISQLPSNGNSNPSQ